VTDLLCRLEVNDELKPHRLLNWKIGRLGALQNLVHKNRRAPKDISGVDSVVHETALIDVLLLWIYRWQTVFDGKLDDPLSFGEKLASERHYRSDLLLLGGLKCAF